jgi:oligopeptide/dipeptide ABC transporter ATP-binding protein
LATQNGNNTMLEVKNLKTYFYTEDGVVKAVDGVDFFVNRGEVLGLVGESGCGKSVTSLSIMRLIGAPGQIVDGQVLFDGENLLDKPESEMVQVRGNRISMIFQQPQSSLNPVFKVGDQIAEVLNIHRDLGRQAGWDRAIELLRMVGIPDAPRRAHAFPHELSGGMAQRVMIAMALACIPELLIADEPTTALDVTIQAQILDLIRDLRTKVDAAIILITHDLGVIAELAERVAVMYAGRIVEQTNVKELFAEPKHPYTQGLIGSIPVLGKIVDTLAVIPGSVPNLVNLPAGCKFAPRCLARVENNLTICTDEEPELLPIAPGHNVRCWLYHSRDDAERARRSRAAN